MFAMCQAVPPANPLFCAAKGNSQLEMAYLLRQEYQPDTNLNFMGEQPCDANENWSQSMPGILVHEAAGQRDDRAPQPSDNEVLLMQRQREAGRATRVSQGLMSETLFLASEEEEEEEEEEEGEDEKEEEEEEEKEEEEEEDIRKPPEGAEGSDPEQEKTVTKENTKGSGHVPSSPLKDNGYASSSFSIESPDRGGASAWEADTLASEGWKDGLESGLPVAEVAPSSEVLFPALEEAFQNLQDKKRFKEQEKQKHHLHLVMYRRLALLRWIRSLQQKVVDQQNRLQESFDTILDNRKELIRCFQHGMTCTKNPLQGEF